MASAQVDIPRRERPQPSHRNNGGRGGGGGGDSYRPRPRSRTPPPVRTEEEKQATAKAEYEKLLTMRSGGTYIPPARLRALQAQITDKSSKEYQRMAWEALKKSINGLINKVNTANIKHIVPELFAENLVRGRGLFCRSMMKAQAASLPFTPIYAAMAAIVNTKLPQVGELLVKRLVIQFRKGFKRNDKSVCLSSTTFIAHLVNQQVQHVILAGQLLLLLLNKPTDDSVEIAVGFCREVGQFLEEVEPAISRAVFDQFRTILHEASIDKRTQYMIEVLFQVRKDKFKDNSAIKEELDLVEEEDQITHKVELDGDIDVQDGLNIFKFDPEWEEHEEAYKRLKAEILGEGTDDDDDDDDDGDDDSSEEEEEDAETKAIEIKDQSNADLVNLRRTIYLTIMSSADPEEAVHKLMKINLPAGQEHELPSMIVECCSQEKTYTKFFGLIGERFSKINRLWCDLFQESFAKYYETIHRYENNKLRNIAHLFGHMFGTDAIPWHCLSVIHLNEDETTSSSRIFIKILFQVMAEELGMPKLRTRLTDETLRPTLEGLFPRDNSRNIRFSINYFTSIGMGVLTEEMREYLQNMPKPALPAPAADGHDSDSDSLSSYSSYTGSSRSRSYSRTPSRSRSPSPQRRQEPRAIDNRGRSFSRSPSVRHTRNRSYSYTPSQSRSRSPYSKSASPPPRRRQEARRPSYSRSRSPPSRGGDRVGGRQRPPLSPRTESFPGRGRPQRDNSRRSSSPPRPRNSSSLSSRGAPRRTAPARVRDRSPVRGRGREDSYSRSRSRSASYDSRSPPRSHSPSRSRSRSPEQRYNDRRRRRGSSAYSRSPSPPPRRDGRGRVDAFDGPSRGRDDGGRGRSRSPVPPKRRRYSESRSRSPPPLKRGRRDS